MAVIKCKMCGGDMELSPDKTFGTCEYCGSTMTLPKVDDEQRAAAFNRGNHFRRIGEFDKALSVYERIVQENETDAEAHWCCALCRFGIEYVEDPATYEWLPTCHRASFDSFLEDVDYLAALKYSDGITRRQYQRDGVKIAEVQRGILATSQNEEPFDVFLCYKESDENGNRTVDSTLAQDIYYQLTNQGRRVFFARITLEDKAGAQYEPYIFAALNSARVMIAVGTKPEHFNAVWVKNEWSRFLSLMKKDRSKLLLPCYRDMDPYDLPEQLSVLQSYDMGKIGFIQDLIRGVNKVLDADKQPEPAKETVVVQQSGGANTEAIMKRGRMALEDGEWERADAFWEEVLNQDAECAEAYTGKRLAANQCRTLQEYIQKQLTWNERAEAETLSATQPEEERIHSAVRRYAIANYLTENEISKLYPYDLTYPSVLKCRREQAEKAKRSFEDDKLLRRAFRFAKGTYKEQIEKDKQDYFAALDDRIARAERKDSARIAKIRAAYGEHLDKADKEAEALFQEASARCERDYQFACEKQECSKNAEDFKSAASCFSQIGDYKDSIKREKECREKAIEVKLEQGYQHAREEQERSKNAEDFENAASCFSQIGDYKDSIKREKECREKAIEAKLEQDYQRACGMQNAASLPQEFEQAAEHFQKIGDYKDSKALAVHCRKRADEEQAKIDAEQERKRVQREQQEAARRKKQKTITVVSCAAIAAIIAVVLVVTKVIIPENQYKAAEALLADGQYEEAIVAFEALEDYRDSQEKISECEKIIKEHENELVYQNACQLMAEGCYEEALAEFESLGGYGDSVAKIAECENKARENIREYIVPYQTTISAGGYHTVGLKSDGTVVAVGDNEYGQCDISDWSGIVAVSAGGWHTVGLKSNGTVVAVGYNNDGRRDESDWKGIVAVSAGGSHTVGLKSDGTVVAVGNNKDGQCDVSDWRDIVAVSAGYFHTIGLKSDGTVVAVGYNEDGQCNVTDWQDIVAVSVGALHTVGLKSDGTVVVVGYNEDGRCNVTDWQDIVAVSTGGWHTVGLKSDGTVVAVGDNEYGQCDVSDWRDIVAVSANEGHTVGLKSDGTVVAVGRNYEDQCDISGWKNIGPAK